MTKVRPSHELTPDHHSGGPSGRGAGRSDPAWAAVLFDLDGTPADTVPLILRSYRHTMQVHRGRELPDSEWLRTLGTPLREQLKDFARDDAEVDAMASTYGAFQHRHHDEMVAAFPGALEALVRLRAERTAGRCRDQQALHHDCPHAQPLRPGRASGRRRHGRRRASGEAGPGACIKRPSAPGDGAPCHRGSLRWRLPVRHTGRARGRRSHGRRTVGTVRTACARKGRAGSLPEATDRSAVDPQGLAFCCRSLWPTEAVLHPHTSAVNPSWVGEGRGAAGADQRVEVAKSISSAT